MVPRVERAGFPALEFTRAYEQAEFYPNKWLPRAASYLTSPAVAEEARALIASQAPDLIVVDAMFPVALVEAARSGRPTVVMCHTSVHRIFDLWRRQIGMMVGLRAEAGFAPLTADLDTLWMSHDRLVATTLKSLDDAPSGLANSERIRHVGPVLERERHGLRVELPWPDDDARPLALVSFSTAPEQGSPAKFQHAIDALAALPVRAVVTVGDSVAIETLRPAPNVHVVATADHDDLMRRASIVLTHGGHGTLMRALKHGLPMALVPGLAHDQAPNAAAAQAWGVGLALPGDADAAAMRDAARELIANPSYRERALAISRDLAGVDGASRAADEIEALLAERPRMAS